MKIWLALAIVVVLGGSAIADSFEFLAYTPPKSWTKQTHPTGAVSYTTTAHGGATIMFVPSVTPIGTPTEEFETYWRANVGPIVNAAIPKARSRPARDLTMVWGSTRVTRDGQAVDVQVVMFVGRGSVLGMVTLTSSAQSVKEVAAFNATVKILDENRPIARPPDPPKNPTTPSLGKPAVTTPTGPATPATPVAAAPAGLGVDYVAPPGFGKTKSENGITSLLYDERPVRDDCLLALYPPLPSSGDLEKDVDSAIQTVPAGWEAPRTSFVTQQKGIGPTGWSYVYKTSLVSTVKGTNGGTATVLVVGLWAPNRHVNFVYGFGGRDCPLEAGFERLFHTIVPKGWTSDGGKAFKAALEKKGWRAVTSSPQMTMRDYAFQPSGRYRQAVRLKGIKPQDQNSETFAEGTWKLAGSTVLLSPDGNGTKETLRVRVVSDYTLAQWRDAIVVLTHTYQRTFHELAEPTTPPIK